LIPTGSEPVTSKLRTDMTSASPDISIVLPVYNEEKNIPELFQSLLPVLDDLKRSFEIIVVDDGSLDKSMERLGEIAEKRPEVQVIEFRHNRGQTAAIQAGIDYSRGDIIITSDSDLQNDPSDIPRLLAKLDEGYDLVSGWRQNRKDARIRRTLVSRVANWFISRMSGLHLRDYGCTLKAYRREVVSGTHRLYGEMHRFIPIYASWVGAKITEIEVEHHARRHGHSNYGLERVIKVVLDLFVVLFIQKYFEKPIYIFGGFGIASTLIGILCFIYMLYLKLFEGISMISTPLPLASSMFILIGFICLLLGLLAEIMIRIYYESQNLRTYDIKSYLNKPDQD